MSASCVMASPNAHRAADPMAGWSLRADNTSWARAQRSKEAHAVGITGDPHAPQVPDLRATHGRYLAANISSATYVEVDGADQLLGAGDPEPVVEAIRTWLGRQCLA